MSYMAVCTFDLESADYDDYEDAYADLEQIGLNRIIRSSKGKDIKLPTTTTFGEFNGESSDAVRDHVMDQVKRAFKVREFGSKIFVAVGDSWSWSHATT